MTDYNENNAWQGSDNEFEPNTVENYDVETDYVEELTEKRDEFLDVYNQYMQLHTAFAKNLVKRKAIELEVIDPTFDFEIE